MTQPHLRLCLAAAGLFLCASPRLSAQPSSGSLGIFTGQTAIGHLNLPSQASYDAANNTYTLQAAGENIWNTADSLHFVWKQMSGDLSLSADVHFPVTTGTHSMYRKAVLMFRQDLAPASAYADAAQHGSGMVALQYRRTTRGDSQGIEVNIPAPQRIRLLKRGDTLTLFVSQHGEPLHQVGASTRLHLQNPFYVGIGLSAHNGSGTEIATFSNVDLKPAQPLVTTETTLYSSLQIVSASDSSRRGMLVYSAKGRFDAPNWSRDGKTLLFNQDGRIMTVPVQGGVAQPLDIGAATHCNGSHGLSPNSKLLAISCAMPDEPHSRVYIVPVTGGSPRLITPDPNSYWHAWSPDAKTIFFVRPGNGSFNILSIAVEGGSETALTTGAGTNDDPDCSPDGRYVYFHSDRTGSTQVWRMRPDGSSPEQVTFDDLYNNRTPHVSPDGKWMTILSYRRDLTGPLTNRDVLLRVMDLGSKKVWTVDEITGGSGTINVPSWSPDSTQFAFVAYQQLPNEDVSGE